MHDGYPMLIAFLSKIFWMHPLVIVNRVLASMEIILMNWSCMRLPSGCRQETAGSRTGQWGFMQGSAFFATSLMMGRGFYLWQRTAESKSMLANLYLPLALLALLLLAKEDRKPVLLGDTGDSLSVGASLSISGIFILCVMIGGGLLALLFHHRRWRYWVSAALCMTPGLLVGIIRLLL